jgi:hypothetical protein
LFGSWRHLVSDHEDRHLPVDLPEIQEQFQRVSPLSIAIQHNGCDPPPAMHAFQHPL